MKGDFFKMVTKKFMFSLTALIFILMISLVGCNGTSEEPQTTEEPAQLEQN